MRIALTFPGCHRRGGVERVMLECANFLAERSHETHVYATEWDEAALRPAIIQHHVPACVRPSVVRLLSFARQSKTQLRQLRPSAEVVGGFGVLSPPGAVVWVQSVHRAWLEVSGRQRNLTGRLRQKGNPTHPVVLAMEYNCFARRKYKKLIALSEQVKEDLIRFYNVPGEDVVILPNGYAPAEFNPTRSKELRAFMRGKLGYSHTNRVVLFVANELERKGFGTLLRAIASLRNPDVRLLVVGRVRPNPYAAEIKRLGMFGRVRFTGPTSDVAAYYAAADVFALPTQYEAWGLVIVEAMACGLPVLTSRLAGAAVAVREGETGQLLDHPNHIHEVATKLAPLLEGAHATREAVCESVADYSWPRLLVRYEQVLRQNCEEVLP